MVVRQISNMLSKQMGVDVKVESVNIRLISKVVLKGIYVEDINSDTIVYVKKLDANLGRLQIRDNIFTLNSVKLYDGVFNLRSDSIGTNVTQVLQNVIKQEKDTIEKEPSTIHLRTKALDINNFRYTMKLLDGDTVEEQPEGIIYKNMSVDNIYLSADRISIKDDTLKFRVNNFSLKERSGFTMQMTVDSGYICFGADVTLKEVRLIDEFSDIRMRQLSMIYNGGEEFKDFINNVKFVVDAYNSDVSFTTLGYFAPVLGQIPATVKLNGLISGPVANFRSENFSLQTLDKTILNGRFSLSGLPEIENTIIFADLKNLSTYSEDILTILRVTNTDLSNFESYLNKFGGINFHGTFTGLVNDFVSHGSLSSDIGEFKMDLLVKTRLNNTGLKGNLIASRFNVGKFVDSPIVGFSDFNFMVDGNIKNGMNDIFGSGTISSLELNDYNYKNAQVEGRMINQAFEGMINITEPNIDLEFNGNIDLAGGSDHIPVFDFDANVKYADLVKLNFNKRDTIGILKTKVNANFKASSILNYVGELTVDNIEYTDEHGNVNIENIKLTSYNDNNRNYLELKSDFMDATYYGQDDLGGFISQLEYITYQSFPNFLSYSPKISKERVNPAWNYDLKIHLKNTENVTRILVPGLSIEETKIDATIDTTSKILLKINSDRVSFGNSNLSDLKIEANNADSLRLLLNGNLFTSGVTIKNLQIDNTIFNNLVLTDISFEDKDFDSHANIDIASQFERTTGNLSSLVDIRESAVTLFGKQWDLNSAKVEVHKDKLSINGFNFHRKEREIRISGVVSGKETDSLLINIDNFELDGLNPYIASSGYQVGGVIFGEVELRGLYGMPLIIGGVQLDSLVVNNDSIGSVIVGSMWNNEDQRLAITTRIYDHNRIKANINGYIEPSTKEISGNFVFNDLGINPIEPLLSGIASNINGTVDGEVKISGTLNTPNLNGNLKLKEVGLKVDYLQTNYIVNATADIVNSQIHIKEENGRIRDIRGNEGTLKLDLANNFFKDINFEASATIRNLLSLNTKKSDNPLFYGTAYTTGVIKLTSSNKDFKFNITAATEPNSLLYIPLESTSSVKEFEFLSFVNKHDTVVNEGDIEDIEIHETKGNISLGFDLAVKPSTEIQILIDPKVGDIIKARGEGNLKINVNPALDLFSIVGDYAIENGEYNFTVPGFSIISRKFSINRGSNIHFNGDVSNAILDVTASYRERVSLAPIFPEDSLRSHPVYCQIRITGQMTKPTLKFNVDIQDLDPEKKALFQSVVNTDEKMTRQFLSILAFGSLMREQNAAGQDFGSASIMANATDLLSSQISNLISAFNLPIPIDVSVDYNDNSYNASGSKFGVDISTQLFDRVILNGSASNASQSNRSFVGDFEAEVLMGKQGKTRFKAFSKSRDYFSDDMENNRNGVGISYQSQFNKFSDLFKRRKKKTKEVIE